MCFNYVLQWCCPWCWNVQLLLVSEVLNRRFAVSFWCAMLLSLLWVNVRLFFIFFFHHIFPTKLLAMELKCTLGVDVKSRVCTEGCAEKSLQKCGMPGWINTETEAQGYAELWRMSCECVRWRECEGLLTGVGVLQGLWTISVRHWSFWELDYWGFLLWSQTAAPSGHN